MKNYYMRRQVLAAGQCCLQLMSFGLNITGINLCEDFYTVGVMGTVKIECNYVSTGSCSFFESQSAVLKASQGKILYRLAFLETTY